MAPALPDLPMSTPADPPGVEVIAATGDAPAEDAGNTPPEAGRQPGGDLASAPPRRIPGTRSRAGNAMARTRAGLLEGAQRAVARQGTKHTTMNDIASGAGVAKATLYNHFRTKDDVWSALVTAEVEQLAEECAGLPLASALNHAATRLSAHPALRQVASTEPAVLAGLLLADPFAAGWRAARQAVRRQLATADRSGDDLVVRWLASFLTSPGQPDAIALGAECIAAVLPTGSSST